MDGRILIAPPPFLLQQDLSLEMGVVRRIVLGEEDLIASHQEVRSRISSSAEELTAIIPKADHSFWGKEEALGSLIREVLSLPSQTERTP